ncbi:MAG TPA: hypothetical protein VGS41_16035 [Chthonomonadales bacterium]|nr:hypothetical protein [Chthonomonadales bacterium]
MDRTPLGPPPGLGTLGPGPGAAGAVFASGALLLISTPAGLVGCASSELPLQPITENRMVIQVRVRMGRIKMRAKEVRRITETLLDIGGSTLSGLLKHSHRHSALTAGPGEQVGTTGYTAAPCNPFGATTS